MMHSGAGAREVCDAGYMRAVRWPLRALGQWPRAPRAPRALLALLITFTAACLVSLIMYVKKNIKIVPFTDLGPSYINIAITFLALQRLTIIFLKKYCSVVETFILEFHLKHHEHKNGFAAKEHHRTNTICGIASVIINIQMFFGIILYNVVPLYNNIKSGMFSDNRPQNGTFEQAVYYLLPFDQYTDTTSYLAMFIFNWYPTYCVSSIIGHYDLLLTIMVFHISGHLNILKHSLQHFPRPRPSPGDQPARKYNEEAFVLLKDVIIHYEIIKKFMADLSEAFGIALCAYLAFHQVIGCVLLLECSSLEPEALSRYGLLTLVVFQQLIQTSIIFEIIHSKSETLGDEVYALPWELMDVGNRRMVLLLLRNVQTSLAVKAGGMVPVGVLTMYTIIKTSVSYFVMLNTLAK